MASTAKEVGNGIATWINAGSYSQTFTATVRRAPRFETESFENLTVYILVLNRKTTQIARGRYQRSFAPIVGVDKSVNYTDATAVDAMDLVVEEIEDRLYAAEAITLPTLGWKVSRLANDLEVNQEWLWENNVYAARIISTWVGIS